MIKAVIFDLSGVLIRLKIGGGFEVIKENFEFAKNLKNKYKLGILSNLSSDYIPKLKKEKFYQVFDEINLSGETGLLKPDKKSYFLILEKLKVNPEESVFIDDSIENIKTAEEIKMKTIFYQEPKDLNKHNLI